MRNVSCVCIFSSFPRMRGADAKTGVSWREIGVKARTGWQLEGFRNRLYPVDTFGEMTSASKAYARNRAWRFCKIRRMSHRSLSYDAWIRAGWKAWAHEEGKEKQLERARETEGTHWYIFCRPTRLRRTTFLSRWSRLRCVRRARDKLRERERERDAHVYI